MHPDAVNSTSGIKGLICIMRVAKMGGLRGLSDQKYFFYAPDSCILELGGSLTPSAGKMLKLFCLAGVVSGMQIVS